MTDFSSKEFEELEYNDVFGSLYVDV